jgi:hypothetical protein
MQREKLNMYKILVGQPEGMRPSCKHKMGLQVPQVIVYRSLSFNTLKGGQFTFKEYLKFIMPHQSMPSEDACPNSGQMAR